MKQIIYSKFSNERNYRFAIRTDICEDENGQRSVRKVCSSVQRTASYDRAVPVVSDIF